MPASMTTVDALLKEVYQGRLQDQIQNETVALKRLERTSDGVVSTVGGRYVDFPIRVTRNTGIGYRNENEALQASGQQGYAAVHVPLHYGYGRVRFTGQVMELAEKNYQAFASSMDNEMEYLKSDITKDSNRVAHGDGTGLLASITDTATSTSHTVDNPQNLDVGENTDVLVRSTGANVTAANVLTDIVTTTSTVTFTTSFVGALTQGVYRQGNFTSGVAREPSGLGNILSDTSTLHGLAPASQRKWAAVIAANGGVNRALSESLMIKMCDDIRVNGSRPTAIFSNLGVRRAYFNLLTQQRRYTDTKEFAGGFQGLPFNYGKEIPFVEDVDCPKNKLRFITEDEIKIYRSSDWHWANDDGTVLKWVVGFDAWEALLKSYWEIGTSKRNAHGEIQDITEG